ncbi:MAG: hypothetical protein QM699_16730 [Amaricoccus sp.]|uniref:hypothetical protein n=1 Tax=Amaricoccus sp. TaxID=1872485 RepID=UPI0039E2D535
MTRTTTLAADPHADVHSDRVPERGAASAVRSAVQSLFARLGAGTAADDPERARLIEGLAGLPPAERVRRGADKARRARAEATFRTVEGGGPAALALAFDVFSDHVDTVERRLERQAEALKAIQLYAPDPWVRRIAQQALLDNAAPLELPSFLIDSEDDRIPLEVFRFIG